MVGLESCMYNFGFQGVFTSNGLFELTLTGTFTYNHYGLYISEHVSNDNKSTYKQTYKTNITALNIGLNLRILLKLVDTRVEN